MPAARHNVWILDSERAVDSLDALRHIDWILDQLVDRDEAVARLMKDGWEVVISVFWVSASGHGGPQLSPKSMQRLGALGVGIWFDFYDASADSDTEEDELP